MRIKIIQVGDTKDKYLETGIAEYVKRIGPYAKLEITTLKEAKPAKTVTQDQCREEEAERILKQVSAADQVVALDERGQEMDSQGFAEMLGMQRDSGQTLTFVIGGPFGLSQSVLARADVKLALSQLTFTHRMVRLILLEQIFRGLSILMGKEYHN